VHVPGHEGAPAVFLELSGHGTVSPEGWNVARLLPYDLPDDFGYRR
jgi:hypothetical protein